MSGTVTFHLTVTFAIVMGTAAGVLALLSWEVFRQSAFGRVIFVLTALLSLFILYHVVLLGFGEHLPQAEVLQSLLYTAFAVFIGLMIRTERRMRKNINRGA
jgi:hypothetical protein